MSIPTQFDPIGINDWIPKGYKLIQSVKFNGNTVIDTGYLPSNDDDFLLVGMVNEYIAGRANGIYGSNGSGAYPMSYIMASITTGSPVIGSGLGSSFNRVLLPNTQMKSTFEISINGTFYNGERLENPAYNITNTANFRWLIGGYNHLNGTLSRTSKLRFYYARLLRGNLLLAEYFPLKRLSDSTFHVYDRVSKSFPTVIGDPLEE